MNFESIFRIFQYKYNLKFDLTQNKIQPKIIFKFSKIKLIFHNSTIRTLYSNLVFSIVFHFLIVYTRPIFHIMNK